MSMILELIPAAIGTVAFAVLFAIPRRFFPYCAIVGAAGWFLYRVMISVAQTGIFAATLFATALVVLLSRFFAVVERCPATVFVTAGLFPLVPGAGIYWTAYYLVSNQLDLALVNGMSACQAMIGIVLGMVFIFELPYSFFRSKKKT